MKKVFRAQFAGAETMISLKTIKFILLCLIATSLLLSLLNVNSNAIVALIFIWLIEGDLKRKFTALAYDKLFLAFLLYLVVHFAGLAMSEDRFTGWKEFESKMGFLALPVIICSSTFIDQNLRRRIMLVFTIALTAIGVYCIGAATVSYAMYSDETVFFYHEFVKPIHHHAVYFAVFTFISLAFMMGELRNHPWFRKHQIIYYGWIIFYLLLIVLLSSKMVLLVTALYLVYMLFHSLKRVHARFWHTALAAGFIIGIVVVVSITNNPVKKRFADLKGNIEMLSLPKYTDAMYFNGWQFRLMLWRFTYEIIRDDNVWLTGVGPTNEQEALKKKYLEMGLYAGLESRGDQGYLEFNCHNQFLQSALQSGIPGLLAMIFWSVVLIVKTMRKKNLVLSWIVIIIFAFFLIESVFERQFGMILTTFFPLLFLYTRNLPPRH